MTADTFIFQDLQIYVKTAHQLTRPSERIRAIDCAREGFSATMNTLSDMVDRPGYDCW